ncbi:serine hydrolase [Virgisporangium aliadipatigenens]|uniref:Serine hydrolase n=1 Tax=Virgisporangium aliadipatigenens TaxID=741659 RepID=A0A8J3YN19_9ACTN|nr:serine hydrolase [Virgisporangium aliadipatigenens]GIJ48554.1 serine hydrolase [Virgisporangium aliadipatigenens]
MSIAAVLRDARDALAEAGLRGSFLVRDLDTGDELGIEPDVGYPVSSLAKIPLAVATLERVRTGALDPALPVVVPPGRSVAMPGPPGISRFRHPATVALEDLLYLAMAISDNAAADALFGFTPPEEVTAMLRTLGFDGIVVRHAIDVLNDTPAERFEPRKGHLAHSLAIGAATEGRGHPLPQLDVSRASTGSARAFVDLLAGLWRPSTVDPAVARGVRDLMAMNLHRQRLAPDFASDAARWSSKTGTLLNLRHEVGVVEHLDGPTYAVAALTESSVPAVVQPGAEAVMAQVARSLRDRLRAG